MVLANSSTGLGRGAHAMTSSQMIRRTAHPTHASDEIAMEFGHAHAVLVAPHQGFHGLSPAERLSLSRWLAAAREAGIDAAEDLGTRPWPSEAAQTIIGVFKSGHLLASWLVVGKDGDWAVACCADGLVSPPLATLSDALALVCPVEPMKLS
jgi:hypothetical protein